MIAEHFRKTGCYHANHQFIIQRRLVEDQPDVPMKLYNAFLESKRIAQQRDPKEACLYFPSDTLEQERATYGNDFFPIGLKAMHKTLERAMQGSLEQGLIRKPIKIDEIYHPTTRGT